VVGGVGGANTRKKKKKRGRKHARRKERGDGEGDDIGKGGKALFSNIDDFISEGEEERRGGKSPLL